MRPCIGALYWRSPILTPVLLSHCKSLHINVKVKGQRPIKNGRKRRVEFEEKYSERLYCSSDSDRRDTNKQPLAQGHAARTKELHTNHGCQATVICRHSAAINCKTKPWEMGVSSQPRPRMPPRNSTQAQQSPDRQADSTSSTRSPWTCHATSHEARGTQNQRQRELSLRSACSTDNTMGWEPGLHTYPDRAGSFLYKGQGWHSVYLLLTTD